MHSPAPTHTNRLAREKSPYLLQHAHNPVDWYPWGEEAFARARAEDKPIFLSIGYSTCHWCHVMERESFEDETVAAALNADFVAVKVDREERPDVDRLYMTAMQALGQGGGWPLNVFLTPALEPFWGGTYFAPTARQGRPGLVELLPRIAEVWRDQRAQIRGTGEQVLTLLQSLSKPAGDVRPATALAEECAAHLAREVDAEFGGFGTAPKFPSPANAHFLLRRWARGADGAESARRMALAQLEAMRIGGIHDHLGGGFHRYATDRAWRIPHFEKMLYDQALLAEAYLDAYRATGEPRWAETARGIFRYLERDLTSPEGAFYSAEDADSEGEEGRFYAWTPAQLVEVLGEEAAAEVASHYGVGERGNFEHGTTVLHLVEEPSDPQKLARLAAAREKLRFARERRPRPHRDDKVITAWNALMIAALAQGARALHEPALATRAARAAEFVWQRLRTKDGALLRRWRDGEAAGAGQLDDHAGFARAALELFVATHEPVWLERAASITEIMIARFWDHEDGGFFDSPAGPDGVVVRLKDGHDGAELAGNSLAVDVLWRLGSLLERADWLELATRSFTFHARRLSRAPWAMPHMLSTMERAAAPSRHVVLAGDPDAADTRALLDVYEARLRPDEDLVVVHDGTREALARLAPFTAALPKRGGRATAYVCLDHQCLSPVHEPHELTALIDR